MTVGLELFLTTMTCRHSVTLAVTWSRFSVKILPLSSVQRRRSSKRRGSERRGSAASQGADGRHTGVICSLQNFSLSVRSSHFQIQVKTGCSLIRGSEAVEMKGATTPHPPTHTHTHKCTLWEMCPFQNSSAITLQSHQPDQSFISLGDRAAHLHP